MQKFFKNWTGILIGAVGLLAAVLGYYISPNSVFIIGKFPTLMFLIGFFLIEGTVLANMWRERDLLKNKDGAFNVHSVVQSEDNSVVLLLPKDERSRFINSAMSVYYNDNDFESWLGFGGIVNVNEKYYQVLVSGLNVDAVQKLLDQNLWSNLKVRASFPFDTLNSLINENQNFSRKLKYQRQKQQSNFVSEEDLFV